MECKVLSVLLVMLLMQISQEPLVVEGSLFGSGATGLTTKGVDALENIVHQFLRDPASYRQQFCSINFCVFADCVINDTRGDSYARSIAVDCFLEQAVHNILHNTTLQQEVCSYGPENLGCKFANCILKDTRSEADAKAIGRECYSTSYLNVGAPSSSPAPSSPGSPSGFGSPPSPTGSGSASPPSPTGFGYPSISGSPSGFGSPPSPFGLGASASPPSPSGTDSASPPRKGAAVAAGHPSTVTTAIIGGLTLVLAICFL